MSQISAWLLSMASVVVLSVLAEFVLPEGQINKYVRVIFSFVILFAIVAPLPKLLGKEIDFSNYFDSEQVLQEDFLQQINLDTLTTTQNELSQKVQEAGLKNVTITISANILSEKLEIFKVNVDLCELEYDENFENKNISSAKQKILEIVGDFSLLDGVAVEFYD